MINRKVPFLIEVARGRIEGFSFIHKFGRNPDIDSGFEAIWEGGGDYTGHDPTGAELVEVFSSDDNDGAGTDIGAKTVEIIGLDGNYLEQTEVITLNGTTGVDSASTYIRVHRMIVRSAGSNNANLGTITARQKVTTANIFCVLPIGYNQTMIAAYTIPAGKRGYMTGWFASLAKKQAGFSNVRFLLKPFGEVFQVKEEMTIATTGGSYFVREYSIPKNFLTEKADIKIMADSSVADMGVAGGFDLLLVTE